MMKKISRVFILSLVLVGMLLPLAPQSAKADEFDQSFRIQLESLLFRFKNYRYSIISVYEMKELTDVRKAINEKEAKKNTAGSAGKEVLEGVPQTTLNIIKTQAEDGKNSNAIARVLVNRDIPIPDNLAAIVTYYKPDPTKNRLLRKAFIITTRNTKGQIVPNTIIGMIVSYEDEDLLDKAIDRPNAKNVFVYDELKQFDLDPDEYGSSTMYELIMTAFMQNNVKNITAQAQGIGTFARLLPPEHGVSKSLIMNENNVSEQDLQNFMRISEGSPLDYYLKEHEVVVSPDLVSWKRYELQVEDFGDGTLDTISMVTNRTLPKFGVEMKYGIDDINYSSLWSERMTVSALWENVKAGIILPTSGWASASNDLFDQERRLTTAGVGLSGSADFPIKVIPKSGVFRLSGGYVFGDATEATYKEDERGNVVKNIENFDKYELWAGENGDPYRAFDYLIRGNATMHYTFGVAVDADYLMRFGIGASVYTVEKWGYRIHENDADIEYYNMDDETRGGISGKFELMVKNVSTPYGASVQYFDEAIATNIWLQFPVIENTFSIKLDAKGYFVAFRDETHPWERESIITPMARFIVNF